MCINKVFVRDLYRKNNGSYFPCGYCKACRESIARRRARRIRAHHPKGQTCYFVTLTYDNEHVPCISLLDIENSEIGDFCPIYRSPFDLKDIKFEIIGSYRVTDDVKYTYKRFLTLHSYKDGKHVFDDNFVSVHFSKDSQRFLKRLRQILRRDFKFDSKISYYYSPEYGSKYGRIHLHYLFWVDSSFAFSSLRDALCKAWPYADLDAFSKRNNGDNDRDFIEVAKDASHYVSSYVNKSDAIDSVFARTFRLRPSHSLHFGFDEDIFSFDEIFEKFKNRCFEYNVNIATKDGVRSVALPYPRYIRNRYFPKFKGYNRLTYTQVLDVYLNPSEFSLLWPLSLKGAKSFYNRSGKLQYATTLIDRNGNRIHMTRDEFNYMKNSINRAFEYFKTKGFNRYDFAYFVVDTHTAFDSYLYKKSQADSFGGYESFDNIHLLGSIPNESLESLVGDFNLVTDPNLFPSALKKYSELSKSYDDNLKTRDIHQLYNS